MPTSTLPLDALSIEAERRRRRGARFLAEREKCHEDPFYFISTYARIGADDGSGLIPFDLFDYQRDLLGVSIPYRRGWVGRPAVTLPP